MLQLLRKQFHFECDKLLTSNWITSSDMFVWLRTNTYHITGGFLLEAKATVVHLHSRWFYKRLPYNQKRQPVIIPAAFSFEYF